MFISYIKAKGTKIPIVRGASKIKLKNVNKKRMATARRLFFFKFLKASIADLITLLFSSYKTLKAVATATAAIVLLTPANFYHFQRPKFNFHPLSFPFETFGKKLAEYKNRCWGQWKEEKRKKN